MKISLFILICLFLFVDLVDSKRKNSEKSKGRPKGRRNGKNRQGKERKTPKGQKRRKGPRPMWLGPTPPPGQYPKSCHAIFLEHAEKCELATGGYYAIQPHSSLRPKHVECIFDGERGWTVIQNRYSGEVCFNRDWNSYRMGFGCPVGIGEDPDWYDDVNQNYIVENKVVKIPKENTSMCPIAYSSPYHDDGNKYDPEMYPNTYRGPNPQRTDMLPECNGESWLGLEYMFWVQRSHGANGTKLCNYIATDVANYQYVCYDKFQIAGWREQYAIKKIDDFDIDLVGITDQIAGENEDLDEKHTLVGAKFSTYDRDNDKSTRHCANETHSGWWFNDCSNANLNGVYHGARMQKDKVDPATGKTIHPEVLDGLFWGSQDKAWDSLRMTKMFIAPRHVKSFECLYDEDAESSESESESASTSEP